jgi:phosphatidylserine synthase
LQLTLSLQNGVITVLRPDLIDYETNQQFDIVVIAYDLVLPINQRRQVRFYDMTIINAQNILKWFSFAVINLLLCCIILIGYCSLYFDRQGCE